MVLENKEAVMNIVDLKQYIKPGKLYKEKESTFYAQAQIPTECRSNHASCLTQLDNGDILCVWFGGSAEGSGDTKIHLSRLNKGASQWTEPKRISDDYNCSEQNPFIYDFGGGHLWLVHTAQKTRGMSKEEWNALVKSGKAKGSYTMQETAEIRILESFDYGCTFKKREPLNQKSGAFCRQPIIRLSNGDLLMGMWYSVVREGDFERGETYGGDYSVCLISEDNGATWKEYPVPDSVGRVHMQPIELENGRLIALFRSRFADRIYKSYSEDYGRTWTAPVPTVLPSNNSSIQAKKLQSGNIALVYNHTPYIANDASKVRWPANSRHHLAVALSEDGGETFPYIRVIEHGEEFFGENWRKNRECSYPSIIEADDGKLHVSYTYNGRRCIKHVIIDENWIKGE